MREIILLLSLALAAGTLAAPDAARAALAAKSAPASPADATNPVPAADDLLLPMPCKAVMAFRAVGVQAEGYLQDLETLFGSDAGDSQGREFYERRYASAVSGPFSAEDLPAAWRGRLPKATTGRYHYYLMGKYEVSVFQWRAIMDGWCPSDASPLTLDDARPKTGVSWFEAVDFARRYTEWLLKNTPDSLPRFAGDAKNVGYLRLPTEAEWEYAARGGHAVPRPSLREEDFFPLPPGSVPADYAVFRAEGGRAAESLEPIGRRRPNPLGLHDTAGNAAEMAMDSFRFSLGGRLHGSSGGFVRKGGSFLSALPDIMPGRRDETAFFLIDGPNANRDLGLRLALSGINTPAGDRPGILRREWQKAGESENVPQLTPGQDPLAELDRLLASSGPSAGKRDLERLRMVFKDHNIALERQNAAAMENLIRATLFIEETVNRTHRAYQTATEGVSNARRARDRSGASSDGRYLAEQSLAAMEEASLGMRVSMEASVGFYRSNLEKGLAYPEALFTATLNLVRAEFADDSVYARAMLRFCDIYAGHMALLRRGKGAELTRNAIFEDLTGNTR